MTFPNARYCEHGRQRGKCPECEAVADIADLTVALESSESRERALRDEVKRMRDRIERLRGALKTASGRFLDAGHLVSANDCMQWAGDMEPPIMGSNVKVSGLAPHQDETK